MQMCGGFIILSDLRGREEFYIAPPSGGKFLSDLCGREVLVLCCVVF